MPLSGPRGSLSSVFIPAGRLGKDAPERRRSSGEWPYGIAEELPETDHGLEPVLAPGGRADELENPVRVVAYIGWEIFNGVAFLVGEWVRYGVQASQILLAIPPTVILFSGGVWFAVWSFARRPFPALETVPLLDLLEYHNPNFYSAVVLWYYLSPLVAVMLTGSIALSVWKVWLEARKRDLLPFGALPAWPLSPEQPGPEIVIGEVHHPVEPREIFNPGWLTIPERGLYTGIAIFGAVGSGKTSACMHPFAKQLLSWQAGDPEKRAAALMLEVKGDFCHDIRSILDGAGRGDDYLELGMGGLWKWNPLSAWWLDSYSLAYTVASLLNQLFGKGKEPFWQQAYTNLVRWIIELHRVLPAVSTIIGKRSFLNNGRG